MADIKEVVAGTRFPASIGLTDDQIAKGVALAAGNHIQGHPKYFATYAELKTCPAGWLMPGNEGNVYADPVTDNNGKYTVQTDLVSWAKNPASATTLSVSFPTSDTRYLVFTERVKFEAQKMVAGLNGVYFVLRLPDGSQVASNSIASGLNDSIAALTDAQILAGYYVSIGPSISAGTGLMTLRLLKI